MHKTSATLLIIDDDDVVRASLAAYLEDSGFKVLQANNGLQGLEVFRQESPELMICDLRMPQVDGLELIRRINALGVEVPVSSVVLRANVDTIAFDTLRGTVGVGFKF